MLFNFSFCLNWERGGLKISVVDIKHYENIGTMSMIAIRVYSKHTLKLEIKAYFRYSALTEHLTYVLMLNIHASMSSNLRNEEKPWGLCYGSFGFY